MKESNEERAKAIAETLTDMTGFDLTSKRIQDYIESELHDATSPQNCGRCEYVMRTVAESNKEAK